jgi:hypothetical protein
MKVSALPHGLDGGRRLPRHSILREKAPRNFLLG